MSSADDNGPTEGTAEAAREGALPKDGANEPGQSAPAQPAAAVESSLARPTAGFDGAPATREPAPSASDASGAAAAPSAPPADPAAVPAGQLIAAHYRVESGLGTGSIGRSVRATRLADGKVVALKLVHKELLTEPNFQRRLTRDVEAAGKLAHRHVARTFEHGVDAAEGLFIVRELIDGPDVISAAKEAPLTPRRISELMIQLLSALAEAHRHGLLHRNLKPQNVRVVRDEAGHDQVKVCDFGNPQRAAVDSLPARDDAAYRAPEQGDGGAIDGRADVYAAGVIMYELLTGDVPFRGTTPADTRALHLNQPVLAPRSKRPDHALPRELETVCVKALAKAPGDRHRSPREMSQALRAVIALLGQRADEPLGSAVFAEGGAAGGESDGADRVTMPGEQLRSRTKFWLGAGLLAAVCAAVIMNPISEQAPDPTLGTGSAARSTRMHGEDALQSGIGKLRAGDSAGAIPALRNARRALGDVPEVLRPLGEALILEGKGDEGSALLNHYLELGPKAEDVVYVRSLLRRAEASE